jgi:hypothetical protein
MNRTFLFVTITLICGCTHLQTVTEQDLSKPEATDEFVDFLTDAHNYLLEQQDICKKEYGLSSYERWFYDQETGLIEFFDGDTLKLRITYQEVGSVSKISNTWLWAWANPNLADNIAVDSDEVREFGDANNFERLTKRKWMADEVDGWEMTAIMAFLTNAKGAYRVPGDNVYSFLVFTDIERISQ